MALYYLVYTYYIYLIKGTPAADDFMPVFVFVIIKVNYDKYYY